MERLGDAFWSAFDRSHPARPQSGVADGARARNRPARWHDSLRIRQPKDQVPRLNPQAVIP
ncbi:MAG: hypothetical protein ACKN94_05390, partial [Pirellulaceae bacterium]